MRSHTKHFQTLVGLFTVLAALTALALTVLALAAPALGQEIDNSAASGPNGPADIFLGEVIDVHVVNLPVRVTGRDGQPVTGLTAEDFTLREDGKKVDITNFFEVPARPRSDTAPSDAPVEVASEPSTVVFLIDDFAVDLQNRRLAMGQLRGLIEGGLGDTTDIVLAHYDGTLRIIQQPTRDPGQLLSALDSIAEVNPQGLMRQRERQAYFIRVVERAAEIRDRVRSRVHPADDGLRQLQTLSREVQMEAGRRGGENRNSHLALSSLVEGLAPLPGRKALVYLSEGLSMRPGQAAIDVIQGAIDDIQAVGGGSTSGNIDARSDALGAMMDSANHRPSRRKKRSSRPDELSAVTALATSAQVSIYPWKALGNAGGLGAQVGGTAALAASPSALSTLESNLKEALGHMATATGGSLGVGVELSNLVDRALEDFGGYYSLGFSPKHGGDDRYHRLKLKVKRSGVDVWYPRTYVAKLPDGPNLVEGQAH